MIKIDNLRKLFDGNVVALDNIDLTIETGTFVALLGPSGCGKTTTLNCLAGLLEPTDGKIYFDEKDVTDYIPRQRNIGMVFQSYALYPHLKVIDNIAFPLKQKKVSKEIRHQKARDIAKKLHLEHLLERKPAQLSGGQQQRVAMARALVKEPDILLLDEPMSNLDARLKIEIREEIRRIQQEFGVTSVIVTHDQEEAMSIADKIAILDNGRIQQYDTPNALYHRPANLFVAHFMGTPPMNFINAQLEEQNGVLVFQRDGVCVTVPSSLQQRLRAHAGKAVVIGVRSHQAEILESPSENAFFLALQIVENLGKEFILSGSFGDDYVRLTMPQTAEGDFACLKALREEGGKIHFTLHDDINVFDKETRENIGINSIG